MKGINEKTIKTFFKSKRNVRIVYSVLMIIAAYYAIITAMWLLFLIPLVAMWMVGAEGVEFFNVTNPKSIQRTDISYFTTGDMIDSAKLLVIIAVLVFIIIKLRKLEKKFS